MTVQHRKEAISNLLTLYERDLGSILKVSDKFELDRLPTVVRQAVELIVAKAPKFSNVAAMGMVNHAFSHTIGQCRPYLDDVAYSSSKIVLSTYNVIISGSGSGKSSSYKNLVDSFKPAVELVNHERLRAQVDIAKTIALKAAQQDDPSITIEQVTEDMYQQFLKPLPRTSISDTSTRGGCATLLASIQAEELGQLEITWDEFGLSLKAGGTTEEVVKLTTEMFDVGNSSAPQFKNVEVREETIEGQALSVLAHTSPYIIFKYKEVKEKLSMIYLTAYARRTLLIFPSETEAIENDVVPTEVSEARALTAYRKQTSTRNAPIVSEAMTVAVTRLLSDPEARLVKFSKEAAMLYEDYFEYCSRRAELMEDSSVLQVEMAGRSFKLGKLAAIWALADNTSVISRELLESVIYVAEYTSKYLVKFVHLTNAKPHELLAELFQSGREQHITLDAAIAKGYILRVTKDFKELLDPLNSILRKTGVCRYDEELRTFIYEPFKVVEVQEDSNVCNFAASYKMVHGLTKDQRKPIMHFFDQYREGLCMNNLVNLVTKDTIYSAFKYGKGATVSNPDVEYAMFKSTATIEGNTNLVVIDVDESDVPMETVADFIPDKQFLITTTSNKLNRHKFRILLPINVELKGSDPKQYAYVVRRIAADLLVTMDPASANISLGYFGYLDSDVIVNAEGDLFDITPHLAAYAAGEDVKPVHGLIKPRSKAARKANMDKVMANVDSLFKYVTLAEHGEGSYKLACACLHLISEGATAEELETVINYLNSNWESPMSQSRLDATIIRPYQARIKTG